MTLIFMLSFFEGISSRILGTKMLGTRILETKIEGIWRTLFPSQFKGNKTEGKGKLSDLLGLAKLFMA